jgi:PAS domain S-box-containing protein
MILSDLEHLKLLDVNDGFVEMSGWTRTEAVGRTLTELGAWPNTDERDKLIQLLLEEGKTKTVELLLRTRSGGSVWLLASAELIHQGGRTLLLSQGIDITDRKRIEDERKRLNDELEERFAARGRQLEDSLSRIREKDRLSSIGTLAAGIAHQINNPISGIVAAAQFALLIEDEKDRSKVQEDALVTALSEAKRCGRIVKNVLKFARDEPTAKWIEDLGPEVLRACQLARPYIAERRGRLEVELQEARLMVRMSPIDIEQALINVLRNAAESSPGGSNPGGSLIRVETRRQGRWAQVRVTDDGMGIDDSLHSRVLDPFYTSRQGRGGTGLGLSVAHGIMRDHGGRIRIETAEGGGARVTLELPLVETRDESRGPRARPNAESDGAQATPLT